MFMKSGSLTPLSWGIIFFVITFLILVVCRFRFVTALESNGKRRICWLRLLLLCALVSVFVMMIVVLCKEGLN